MKALLVSGLGRCGSTMVMRALEEGGCPIFERPRLNLLMEHPDVDIKTQFGNVCNLSLIRGAVKLIDARRFIFPGGPVASIFITRDPVQQGQSMAKMCKALGIPVTVKQIAGFASSIVVDNPLCLQALQTVGPVWETTFEELIDAPVRATWDIANFCKKQGFEVDWHAMRNTIDDRGYRGTRATDDLLPYEQEHVDSERG